MKLEKINLYLIFITCLGFCLRLYRLDGPCLWFDEICTTIRIQYTLSETVKHLIYSPFPPLYYIMMKLWTSLFGNNEFAIRFPSLFFSVLSIVFVFKLSKEIFDEKVGLIAALLLSVSAYSINYAQEAKMYAMEWSLGILSFLFFYKYIKTNKIINLFLYIFVTLLCIYTMYVGYIFIVIQNIFSFVFFKRKQLIIWWAGQLVIIFLYLPWINAFFYTAGHGSGIGWVPRTNNYAAFIGELFTAVLSINTGKKNIAELCLYLFLIVSAFINIKIPWKKNIFDVKKEGVFIISWIVIPVIIYLSIDIFMYPILIVRYLGLIHIPLIILISKGLNKYNKKIQFVLLSLLVVIISINHLYPYYKHQLKFCYQEWRELAGYLRAKVTSDDLILSDCDSNVIKYYYKDKEIIPLYNFETSIVQKYNCIYIIYIYKQPRIEESKDYTIVQEYFPRGIGLMQLKKV